MIIWAPKPVNFRSSEIQVKKRKYDAGVIEESIYDIESLTNKVCSNIRHTPYNMRFRMDRGKIWFDVNVPNAKPSYAMNFRWRFRYLMYKYFGL